MIERRPAPQHPYEAFPSDAIDGTIAERFSRMAERYGDRPAIEDGGRTLSYRELDAASAGVASLIQAESHANDDGDRPVAILLEQGADFITALLGVIRAGRFLVSLDPRNPEQRNRLVLSDSTARLLIAGSNTREAACGLAGDTRLLWLENLDCTEAVPLRSTDADSIAMLLYTSGSTGRPKGVIQTHRNVLHNTLRHTNEFRIVPDDRFSLLYPCGVYGGIRDIFNALLNGACLCRYPLELEGLAPLGEWLIEKRISIYCSVATLFRQFVRTLGGQRFVDLRLIKLGGEVVFRSDFEAFRTHFEQKTLLSCGLAATEVGAVRQFFLDHQSIVEEPRLRCGFAVEDMQVTILGDEGQELALGERGEIAVRSRYIAPGYWRRPEQERRVFLADPDGGARRTYRTGDLGWIRDDGHLVHAGRKDHQVKIRGNRVEIAEVEAALAAQPTVREAAVMLHHDVDRGGRLHAFLVTTDEATDETAVRLLLAEQLPAFMVPSRFTLTDRLPLLPNGKVDRQRLATCEPRADPQPVDSHAARGSGTTRELAALWDELLDRRVGIDEEFFRAGGDSLVLLQMMVLVEQRFGVRLALNAILDASTVRTLAARIDLEGLGGGEAAAESPLPMSDDAPGEVSLSLMPIQPRGHLPPLFFVAPAGGSILPYYRLAHLLGHEQPFYGLQVAPPSEFGAPVDIPATARRFLALIRRVHPSGACRFGGWSFGGFVAWAMAAAARDSSIDVETVFVVDSDARIAGHDPQGWARFKALWTLAQMFRHSQPLLRNMIHVKLAAEMKRSGSAAPLGLFARLAWHAGVKNATVATTVKADPRLLDLQFIPGGRMRNLWSYMRGIYKFEPPTLAQRLDLFLPTLDASSREREHARTVTECWSRLAGGRVREHPISGNHFTIFEPPHVERMADEMRVLRDAGQPMAHGEQRRVPHPEGQMCKTTHGETR